MRALGYIPDSPDPRDQHFSKFGAPRAPASASLRKYVVEVLDQVDTSKCVAHSWAQALRMEDKAAGVPSPQLSSRDFLYYNSLAYDGGGFVDQGTQLRSCARGITKFGRPPESACPFKRDPLVERPSWEAYREAFDHKGPAGYHRITTTTEIKQAIAMGHPVVGGAMIGESLELHMDGLYDPDPNEQKIGGHALTFTSYDEASFEVVNSWGRLWGLNGGFARISPRFAATFTDLWAVVL